MYTVIKKFTFGLCLNRDSSIWTMTPLPPRRNGGINIGQPPTAYITQVLVALNCCCFSYFGFLCSSSDWVLPEPLTIHCCKESFDLSKKLPARMLTLFLQLSSGHRHLYISHFHCYAYKCGIVLYCTFSCLVCHYDSARPWTSYILGMSCSSQGVVSAGTS